MIAYIQAKLAESSSLTFDQVLSIVSTTVSILTGVSVLITGYAIARKIKPEINNMNATTDNVEADTAKTQVDVNKVFMDLAASAGSYALNWEQRVISLEKARLEDKEEYERKLNSQQIDYESKLKVQGDMYERKLQEQSASHATQLREIQEGEETLRASFKELEHQNKILVRWNKKLTNQLIKNNIVPEPIPVDLEPE